jgi:hypothetical protein
MDERRMNPWASSESTSKIIPAFVAALTEAQDVTKNKQVNAGQLRYAYADLATVLDQLKPVLTTNQLAVSQSASDSGVQTILLHTSGEWLAFPPLNVAKTQNTPQAHGSAISFARRYAILAAFNIATEDDDGQAAARPADPLISSSQLKSLSIQLRKLVGEDREAGLAFIADAAGRTVTSSKELTTKEAAAVLNALRDAVPQEAA